MPASIRIVLVEPKEAGNVGAVARVAKNFGITDVVVVGQRPRSLHGHEVWWASGADDLLASMREVDTLEEALAETKRVFATSSMRGRNAAPDVLPHAVAAERSLHGDSDIVAIVFGREDSGLTQRESQLAHAVIQIPTSPAFPVMNLAQAVGVICFAATVGDFEPAASSTTFPGEQAAPNDLEQRLHREAKRLLSEAGFLHENNPDRIYDELRRITNRTRLTLREVSLLLALIRQLWWRIGQEDRSD